jgi:hypothetical protein
VNSGSNGGVHRRSAFGQDLRPDLRCQEMAGGDDTAVRHHHRLQKLLNSPRNPAYYCTVTATLAVCDSCGETLVAVTVIV